MTEHAIPSSAQIELLIAEDSPTQAEQLNYCLTRHGYSVTVACDGKKALAAALLRKPRAIISDVVMPEMDGYELCRAVKTQERLKDVPVILLTSLSRPQDIVRGLDCGADSFLRKPYEEQYLLSRIDFILTNRELRKTERLELGVQLHFGGRSHFITAEKQQILDLLISTYEDAVYVNQELQTKQGELARDRDLLAARTAQLAAANKELEAFSYSVSHDLRAPLRHINGFAGVLLEDYAAQMTAEVKNYVAQIQDRSAHMSRMIDDLLKLSRLERRELTLRMTPLTPIVEKVVQELQADCAGRQIDWQIRPLPSVLCDPGLLQLAFINLLSNAVKYTRRRNPAIITVSCTTENDQIAICVRDNGAGFDPQYSSKLFGVFQRLHRNEEFEGVGVGLATVERIVHKHGGEIWAEAEVDKGAAFFFTLENRGQAPAI